MSATDPFTQREEKETSKHELKKVNHLTPLLFAIDRVPLQAGECVPTIDHVRQLSLLCNP